MSISKRNIKRIDSSFRAVDLVETKKLLENLSDKDRKRVQKFSKTSSYYGGKILYQLVRTYSSNLVEFVDEHSMDFLREAQDRIERLCKKIGEIRSDKTKFDYIEYERLRNLITSEKDCLYKKEYGSRDDFHFCTTCNSVASCESRTVVKTDWCTSDFCFGSCSRCEDTIYIYKCNCSKSVTPVVPGAEEKTTLSSKSEVETSKVNVEDDNSSSTEPSIQTDSTPNATGDEITNSDSLTDDTTSLHEEKEKTSL